MNFPIQPLLDRIIVREIPIEEYYEKASEHDLSIENSNIKLQSDRGMVVAVGDCVVMGAVVLPIPVQVGDTVFFNEFSMCDPVYLNPGHRLRSDLPKYWQMRVGDLKGVERSVKSDA